MDRFMKVSMLAILSLLALDVTHNYLHPRVVHALPSPSFLYKVDWITPTYNRQLNRCDINDPEMASVERDGQAGWQVVSMTQLAGPGGINPCSQYTVIEKRERLTP